MWKLGNILTVNSKIRFSGVLILTVIAALLSANTVIAHDEHEEDETSIKIHGDWVVTVANPDGSIAQERSFKNALTDTGKVTLRVLLAPYYNHQTEATEPGELEKRASNDAWNLNAAVTGFIDSEECNSLLGLVADGSRPLLSTLVSPANAVISTRTSTSFTLTRNLVVPANCLSGVNYAITGVSSVTSVRESIQGSLRFTASPFTEKTLTAPITGIFADQVVTLKATISFE